MSFAATPKAVKSALSNERFVLIVNLKLEGPMKGLVHNKVSLVQKPM